MKIRAYITNMLLKIVHVGVSNSAGTKPSDVHKGFMYIPQSNFTRAEIDRLWSSIPLSTSIEDTIQSMLFMKIAGGGFPFAFPYIYSGGQNYTELTDYNIILQAVPYSAKVISEYYSTNTVIHYLDENKNGSMNCNNGVGLRWAYSTTNPTLGSISQLGFPMQSTLTTCRGSGFFITSDNYVGCFFINLNRNNSNIGWFSYSISQEIINWIDSLPDLILDPYGQGGDSSTSVPTGDFDGTSDSIDFPSLPSISATDTGLITLYNPSLSELQALARYMWTNPAFDISAWKKIVADPIDAILGLSIVPVDVPDGGVRHIAVGNILTDVSMNAAAQQYIEVQCGALNINEFWSSYLDYEPYTKAEIYLPYCGVHQLSVDDIMNKTVEVRYHIDILTGSCCAYVKCGDSVLYQFIGQCSSSIPIASGDFSEIVGSALNAALAVGSLAATGGASAPFSVPEITANAVNILKEKIQKSGSLSGTGGMLAIQKPYLILTRPRQAHPANQNHYTGYPSFITENLSELSGYTEIEQIHLENVQATDSELNEIVTLLESGVIF